MRSTNCLSLCLLTLALLLSACGKSKETNSPANSTNEAPAAGAATSVKFVKASVAEVTLAAGGSTEATITLTIQSGYHVNANPPSESYLRATEVIIQPAEGISVGYITYPGPLTKKFAFSEKALAVYEGSPAIKIMLKATAAAAKGQRTIPTKINVQACDEQVCYAPGSLELSLPVTVK